MKLRQAGEEEARVGPQVAASQESQKERARRVDWAGSWRRTFDFDVLV